jgi:hypothetical protein
MNFHMSNVDAKGQAKAVVMGIEEWHPVRPGTAFSTLKVEKPGKGRCPPDTGPWPVATTPSPVISCVANLPTN